MARLAVIASVLVLTGAVAQAQQFKKIPQIGLLSAGSSSAGSPRIEAFRQGLRSWATRRETPLQSNTGLQRVS